MKLVQRVSHINTFGPGVGRCPRRITYARRANFEPRLAPPLSRHSGAFSVLKLRFEAMQRAVLALFGFNSDTFGNKTARIDDV